MIREQFVSFEIAKLLKEIGFDIPINTSYSKEGKFAYNILPNNFNKLQSRFSGPTQSLAARWLREVHGIDVIIDIYNKDYYVCNVYKNKHLMIIKNTVTSVFEESFEEGLRESIKLIKKQRL